MTIEVTQSDRDAAWPYRPSCYKDTANTRAGWNEGVYDSAAPVICAFARHRIAALSTQPADANVEPRLDMLLWCPRCHAQHIDDARGDWDNPPHRSHLCHTCGCIWRPADFYTNGVRAIATVGTADNWSSTTIAATQPAAAEDEVERVAQLDEKLLTDFMLLSMRMSGRGERSDEPFLKRLAEYRSDIARAAIAAMRPEQQWQPVETAPKDGTRLLLYCSGYTTKGIEGRCSVGWYSQWPKMWVHGHSLGPTHWMPTPAPPATACAKQGGE